MRTKYHHVFWEDLHRKARENKFPLRVMFELTYRCNFKCRHCYLPKSYKNNPRDELNTKEVFSILDQLAKIGCFYLGFTGGEPFLRKDIFKILWYAKRRGFQIIIYTNGSLIDADKAEELMRLSPNKIDITIPAINKDSFEKITRKPGSWAAVFRAIDLLRSRQVSLGFKTCLLKENKNELKDIEKFAFSLSNSYRLDNLLCARLDGDKTPFIYRPRIENEAIKRRASCLLRRRFSSFKQGHKIEIPGCGVGASQAAITPFGELKTCVMIDYPRINIFAQNGLRQAWERLRDKIS